MKTRFKTILFVPLICVVFSTQAADKLPCVGDDHATWTNCHGTIETDNLYFVGDFLMEHHMAKACLKTHLEPSTKETLREGRKKAVVR